MYTVIPSFLPRFKSTMEVIFLNAVEYRLRFSLDVRHCFKTSSLQLHFQFGKQSEITGGSAWRVGRMGNNNHVVVSHKLCSFQGCVGKYIVAMKEPVVVAPKFRSFLSHIFSRASQSITVKVRVDHSIRRNKFMVNNLLSRQKKKKKQWACSLLNSRPAARFLLLVIVGSSTVTIVVLFLDHNRKSNFRHPLWS
jgi:hypothetical protein